MFGFGKKYPFIVTVKITGRHPYLRDDSLDMFVGYKYEYIHVMARDYNHAEKLAFGWDKNGQPRGKLGGWARTAISVRRANAGQSLEPGLSDKGAFQLRGRV